MRKLKRKSKMERSISKPVKLKPLKPLKKIKLEKFNELKVKKEKKEEKPTKPTVKRKVKKYYKPQQCAFIKADGTQCRKSAVGKGTLCPTHGGDPVIKENLYRGSEEIMLPNCRVVFNPAYHPLRYIELSREGLSEVEIAAEFEIAVITIADWAEKFESFYIARDIGKAMHEAWWLRQGKENMNERSFNTNLFKYMTMNKLGYSDKIEQKSLNMNVHGVLMVPDAVSEDELEKEEDFIDV
jgi:hypothetical protein